MTGRKSAFVLMPFGDRYDSYYTCIFKPSLEAVGYSVTRGDDFSVPQRPIIQDIQDAIIQSDLLLCDISEENPNVFYELGLAHAVGKPVILVSHKKENIPFDLRHLRIITYDYTLPGWESKLTENIKSAARVLESSGEIWPTPLLPQAEEFRTLGIKRIFQQRKDASPITEALFKDVTGGKSPRMVQMMGQSLAW